MIGLSFARRLGGIAVLATAALLTSGCLFTPGAFDSTLEINKGGAFRFTYVGEISMASMSDLAKAGDDATFEPHCSDPETLEERVCSAEEIEEQKADNAAEKRKQEQFAAMMGGIDMEDPEALAKIAEELRKQKGWISVEPAGKGLFDVRYEIAGTLSHAFRFPMIEQMPAATHFIAVVPRADGSVRVDAPGFGGGDAGPMGSGLGFLAAMSAAEKDSDKAQAVMPDGTFTILTDADILANNTDEGPQAAAGDKRSLTWKVDESSKTAPMALLDLD